jgi:hypothetical protein
MITIRALGRLLTLLLLVVLSLAGLAVAVFSIGSDHNTISLPALADYLQLPELRDTVGDWLNALETSGPVAWWSVLGGAIAVLIGLVLLIGHLLPQRERLVTLEENPDGRVAARRRPLAQAAASLTEQQRGVLDVTSRVRTHRFRAGRLSVRATRAGSSSATDVEQRAGTAIAPLAGDFCLRTRVSSKIGARVE